MDANDRCLGTLKRRELRRGLVRSRVTMTVATGPELVSWLWCRSPLASQFPSQMVRLPSEPECLETAARLPCSSDCLARSNVVYLGRGAAVLYGIEAEFSCGLASVFSTLYPLRTTRMQLS
jgi:hypothetical protein